MINYAAGLVEEISDKDEIIERLTTRLTLANTALDQVYAMSEYDGNASYCGEIFAIQGVASPLSWDNEALFAALKERQEKETK